MCRLLKGKVQNRLLLYLQCIGFKTKLCRLCKGRENRLTLVIRVNSSLSKVATRKLNLKLTSILKLKETVEDGDGTLSLVNHIKQCTGS